MNDNSVSARKYGRLQKHCEALEAKVEELERENERLKKICDDYASIRSEFDSLYTEFKNSIQKANAIKEQYTQALEKMGKTRSHYASEFKRLLATMQ